MTNRTFLKCILLFSFVFSFTFTNGQTTSQLDLPPVISPTPNAASLGIYGQVPVSLFSGLAQTSIPIGVVSAGDISIPISLNYHGGGIRPDIHPSWVGLGWDLNAGGVIIRRTNGVPDENLYLNGNPEDKYGYYYQYARADSSNWAAASTLGTYLVNFKTLGSAMAYPAPDEFIFNFGGYSGSFFFNHKGKWQVKSKSPINLKVEEQLKDYFVLPSQGYTPKTLRRLFYKFILTTPDGTKYIFGGTDQSIEFTRDGQSGLNQDAYGNDILPTSWYLTKVISRDGPEITLNYERDSIQCLLSSNLIRSYTTDGGQFLDQTDMHHLSVAITNPVYLTTIDGPNQRVKLSRTRSTELSYDYISNGILGNAAHFTDLSNSNNPGQIMGLIKFVKLDSISFYSDTATYLRRMAFYYPQATNLRLRLDSLKEFGSNGNYKPAYSFTYNATPLPAYNVQELDHWGYYNGQYFFSMYPKSPESNYNYNDVADYTFSRSPVPAVMQAGMLTDIRYPTGGITSFEYEPHQYSKIAKRFPFIVSDTTGNITCGGLRIRRITNKDASGKLLTRREFLYVRDYSTGGTLSSGILGGYPQYLSTGQFTEAFNTRTYWEWFDYAIEPLSFTDGNHVTYSEVVERQYDSSYTISTFSNHELGTYRDEPPVTRAANDPTLAAFKFDPATSRALERGKLLTTRAFTNTNVMLQKSKYDYDTSAARFAETVRMVALKTRQFGQPPSTNVEFELRGTAYLIYTFPQFVIRQIDTLWDQNGANPIVNVHHFLYNSYRLKTVDSSLNSAQQIVKTTYRYPFDLLGGSDPTGVYQKMVDSNMVEPVVEQTNFVNGIQQKFIKTNYYQPYSWLFSPQTLAVQDRNNPIETRLRYYDYDTKGNLLNASKDNDVRFSYLWDYKQTQPIAEIKNASAPDFAYANFEADNTGYWTYNTVPIVMGTPALPSASGRKHYILTSNALVKSGLTASKTYIISYWTKTFGGFPITGTIAGYPKVGRSVSNWQYVEHRVTGQTTVTISGTGLVDEVRLYPADAQMTTYTFDPQFGMTGKIDENNRITFYEYDEFQRLSLVRDQDRNIAQKICYNYAGQLSDCRIHYNTFKSGVFQRQTGCGCNVGTNVTYPVAANQHSSPISDQDANQKAIDDVIAHGQAYAEANGSCVAPAAAPITGENDANKSIDIAFHNTCTGVNTYYTLSAGASSVNIPNQVEGKYNITFTPVGAGGASFTFIVNASTVAHAPQATINNVNLFSGSNTIVVF